MLIQLFLFGSPLGFKYIFIYILASEYFYDLISYTLQGTALGKEK